MLKVSDKLTQEQIDSILAKLLPREKSPRRRINRLESFVYTKSQEGRDWLENHILAQGKEASEEVLSTYEKHSCAITAALLFEFEAYLRAEEYWQQHKKTPEAVEGRIMDYQQGRWLARFPQNRGKKTSKNVSGIIYDTIIQHLTGANKPLTAKKVFYETSMIIGWHSELADNDRVSECRWSDELQDWELVVVKRNGNIVGHPTKTIEDIAKEGIIARSRTIGQSGRRLILEDVFLGILSEQTK